MSLILSENQSLLENFYHWEKTKPNDVYLKQPFGDTYKDFTWSEVGQQARKLAAYLKSLNFAPLSNIALISKNCAEWLITDIAIMMAGHISVPLYPTLTGEQINQILEHSESVLAFIGKLDDWNIMKPGIKTTIKLVNFPTYNVDSSFTTWEEATKLEPLTENVKPNLKDLFTIIYTSGTTGNPKGVMLTHGAFASIMYHTRHVTMLSVPNITFFSYLPLSHIAERNIVEAASLCSGGVIYFTESLEAFAGNLQKAQPTHFLAVPRIWSKFQLGILSKMPQKKLDLFLKIPLLNSFVKNKIKKGLGLNNSAINLTGAAPISPDLIRWFSKLDIKIQEAYGMTENVGAVCMMPGDEMKYGTVGKVYPGQEVKILKDTGEILTRASWNMVGYFKEPTLTAETIDADGWIHTGDVGVLDSEGFLSITGRVKEMYKTSKGEYVAPSGIESKLSTNSSIEQVCLVGQSLPQPIALVVISDIGKAKSPEALSSDLSKFLQEINPQLKPYERIAKIVILKEIWSVENNKLTPTLKIKRNVIEKEFESQYETWFSAPGSIIFE